MSWQPYPPGTRIAGAEVLSVVTLAKWQRYTAYAVRWECCGSETEITHTSLARRVGQNRKQCKLCASTERGRRMGAQNFKSDTPRDAPAVVIEIPPPGISGQWAHFGKMGSRYGGSYGRNASAPDDA